MEYLTIFEKLRKELFERGSAIKVKSLSDEQKDLFKNLTPEQRNKLRGFGGTSLLEPLPTYIKTESEKVIEGANNSHIVLGRDRPASRFSGYGGKGETQCGTIDIVVGRMSPSPKEHAHVDPNFSWDSKGNYTDAARIYISQKTDVDENFCLTGIGGDIANMKSRSAIAMKADGIRIIGREGIKLVTYTDVKNSQDGKVTPAGIYLITGNDQKAEEELQSLVKGENLTLALRNITARITSLVGIVDSFLTYQMNFNKELVNHTHVSPFQPDGKTPLFTMSSKELVFAGAKSQIELLTKTKVSFMKQILNLMKLETDFLERSGEHYINSRYNKTN